MAFVEVSIERARALQRKARLALEGRLEKYHVSTVELKWAYYEASFTWFDKLRKRKACAGGISLDSKEAVLSTCPDRIKKFYLECVDHITSYNECATTHKRVCELGDFFKVAAREGQLTITLSQEELTELDRLAHG